MKLHSRTLSNAPPWHRAWCYESCRVAVEEVVFSLRHDLLQGPLFGAAFSFSTVKSDGVHSCFGPLSHGVVSGVSANGSRNIFKSSSLINRLECLNSQAHFFTVHQAPLPAFGPLTFRVTVLPSASLFRQRRCIGHGHCGLAAIRAARSYQLRLYPV